MSTERELSFTFEGRRIPARSGQSIAGALHATGTRTLSRGIKYHRPRGYTCGFGACGDCPLRVDGMPSTVSCTTPVRGGERVRRETGLPSTRFDLLRTADLMRPFLRAGFQFTLFARQPRLSRLAGAVLAVLAGGGRAPDAAAAAAAKIARVERHEPEVLVIGGGASGLTAALAAADAGASVLLVDQELIGGRSRVRTEAVRVGSAASRPADVVRELLRRASAHARITMLRGTAIGLIDGLVPVIDADRPVRHEVRPFSIALATGSYETPLLIPGHDLPGVMLPDGALRLAEVEGVRPARRAVVIDGDPRAGDVAAALGAHGVRIVATVPAERVERITGWSRATGVRLRGAAGPGDAVLPRRIRAELVCAVGPRRAAEELSLHAVYGDSGSHDEIRSDAEAAPDAVSRAGGERIVVVGSARGEAAYSLDEASAAGVRLAALSRGARPARASRSAPASSRAEAEVPPAPSRPDAPAAASTGSRIRS
ncbi:2Fe-2S iron-sulfur cluster-binding protein [Leucobacter massiliensis]|uniref:2Fe-2S iron-sulfur cluster-binding protein n=1 Tax=Leucobacter massiliensis TaxID=1686285 RepID=UPI0015E3CAEE|nr:2Fe-2S iron-sulfur cluster-binding protein [Leucobacter massiliensis]